MQADIPQAELVHANFKLDITVPFVLVNVSSSFIGEWHDRHAIACLNIESAFFKSRSPMPVPLNRIMPLSDSARSSFASVHSSSVNTIGSEPTNGGPNIEDPRVRILSVMVGTVSTGLGRAEGSVTATEDGPDP